MVSAIKTVDRRQYAVRSALPRSVHVAEVVSPTLVLELSAPASHRLDATTEDHCSCAHRSMPIRTLVKIHVEHFSHSFDYPMSATKLANSLGPTLFVVDSDVPGFKCIASVGLQLLLPRESKYQDISQFLSGHVLIECVSSLVYRTILMFGINIKILLADVAMSRLCMLIAINTSRSW